MPCPTSHRPIGSVTRATCTRAKMFSMDVLIVGLAPL
jgi:hypothetical protein